MSTPTKKRMKKYSGFLDFVKTGPINTVSLIPTLTACLLVVIWVALKEKFFSAVPQIYNYAILYLASILIGSAGLIYIYRKEMPGPVSSITIRGRWATITGIVLVLFFWGLGIAGFVFALLE